MLYETPYGRKTGLLLRLSMNAHCREENAVELIKKMVSVIKVHAPQDASHEGLEVCDLIAKANKWIDGRKTATELAEKEESEN